MLMPPDDSPFLAAARIVANGLAASNAHVDGPQDRSAEIFLVESSSQTASLDAALDAALVSGADIVVGPIERSAVEMLARKKHFRFQFLRSMYRITQIYRLYRKI